jgi:hypothetical protein
MNDFYVCNDGTQRTQRSAKFAEGKVEKMAKENAKYLILKIAGKTGRW